MLKLKNTQAGPRGVNAVSGPVLVNPGETVEVKVYAREKEHLEASQWFEVKGSYTANPDELLVGETIRPDRDVIDKAVADAKADADKALADKDAEIEALKKQLADALQRVAPALKAEHHGGGKFNVTEGETVHLTGLSKADADAFNALSDDDKRAYVDKAKG